MRSIPQRHASPIHISILETEPGDTATSTPSREYHAHLHRRSTVAETTEAGAAGAAGSAGTARDRGSRNTSATTALGSAGQGTRQRLPLRPGQ